MYTAACTVTITSISPDRFSAGQTITITGSDFGAAQGQGYVWIAQQQPGGQVNWGEPDNWYKIKILSWSDTSITIQAPDDPTNSQPLLQTGVPTAITVVPDPTNGTGASNSVAVNVVNPTVTRLVVDPLTGNTLMTTDANGDPIETNVYGLGLIDSVATNGSYQVYHYNQQGSTVAITSQSGAILDTYAYSLYGGLVSHVGSDRSLHLYDGRDGVLSLANGLDYMQARFYDPTVARFVSEDTLIGSIGNDLSLNRYAYVDGDPVLYVDPTGHSPYDNSDENAVSPYLVMSLGIDPAWNQYAPPTDQQSADFLKNVTRLVRYLSPPPWFLRDFFMANIPEFGIVADGAGEVQEVDILSNKTLTNQTGKVDNYVSPDKGNAAAEADFNAYKPTNVRTYSNGTKVGHLPDGRTINIHPAASLKGTPTVEIYDSATGTSIKIRY